jgi:hypothetical protein
MTGGTVAVVVVVAVAVAVAVALALALVVVSTYVAVVKQTNSQYCSMVKDIPCILLIESRVQVVNYSTCSHPFLTILGNTIWIARPSFWPGLCWVEAIRT